MDWHRPCGCTGGDGGCSYGGGWSNPCKDYPNCVSGVEDAENDLTNRIRMLPQNVEARERERKLKEAKRLREQADRLEKEANT